jgi:signal peptidase
MNSGSMSPMLKEGDDFGIIKIPFNDIKVGDVIFFHRPAGEDRLIVHRVAEIQADLKGERVITTKGDANLASIPGTDFPIRVNNFIGKVYCAYSIF